MRWPGSTGSPGWPGSPGSVRRVGGAGHRDGARRRARTLRAAVISVAATGGLLAALLLPGSGSAAPDQGDQEARVGADYLCRLPGGGRQPVTAELTGTFPRTGTVGVPIRPGPLRAEVTLPPEAADALFPSGTRSVSGTATLTAEVSQNGETAKARWTGLDAPATRVTGGAGVVLGHTGNVPPVTVAHPGDVTFTAGDLALRLLPVREATAEGGASTPLPAQEELDVSCSPRDGDGATLATVSATGRAGDGPAPPASGDTTGADGGGASSPGATDSGRGGAEDGGNKGSDGIMVGPGESTRAAPTVRCPAKPTEAELDPDRLPKPPAGATEQAGLATPGCVVAVGYASVRKLDGSMMINDPEKKPGPMQLRIIERMVTAPGGYVEQDSVGELHLPDAESTFLTFGFQPTTAKVEFQTEPVTVTTVSQDGRNTTTIGYYQRLRLYDVTLNGTPLDVGPRCRSGRADTVLEGEYDILGGGLLEGEITIPPFSGCGSGGEDLDPLLNASIAGTKNRIRIQQGAVCYTSPDCAATVPDLPKL